VMGTRFKVLVLFPTALLGCAMVVVVALFKGLAISSAIAAAIICVTSLQMGYLGGLFTRFHMAASRVTSQRGLRSTSIRN
jgi:hypothetical protein